MPFQRTSLILMFALATGFIGCASTPPLVQNLPSNSNPNYEIDRTQEMLTEARDRQYDVLSPKNYTRAKSALDKAISDRDSAKSNEEVLQQIAYARGWLKEADAKSQIAIMQMKDIQDARKGALNAHANELFPKEWAQAGTELESVTKDIENGKIKPAEKKSDDIVTKYRNLEYDAVVKMALGKADDNIHVAEKDNARKTAPRTFSAASMKYENALRVIEANPRNMAAINRAAAEATRESMHLVDVTRRAKAGNTEDLILQSERQQRTISNLREEHMSAEEQVTELEREQQELRRTQNLINQAAHIRSQLKPTEAEVFTENGRVMVRLKALQFAKNQATLGKKNQDLLKKVNEALANAGPSKIIVEGHTDSLGDENRNQALSKQRAKSVQDFLVANGAVTLDNVESVGLGASKPVSDNQTATGRAQNRRIDIIVEPISR